MRFHSPIGSMYVHLPLKNKQMWANTWYIDGMGQMIRPYMCSSLNSKGRMPTPNYRRGPNKPYIWGHSFFKSSFWASTLNLWKLMLWKWSFLGYHLLRCYVCYMFLPGTLASKFDDNTHTHTHTLPKTNSEVSPKSHGGDKRIRLVFGAYCAKLLVLGKLHPRHLELSSSKPSFFFK